jgi:hypothetical protein
VKFLHQNEISIPIWTLALLSAKKSFKQGLLVISFLSSEYSFKELFESIKIALTGFLGK